MCYGYLCNLAICAYSHSDNQYFKGLFSPHLFLNSFLQGKKGKAKRSYASSLNGNSKPFPSEVGEQGEHSNLSCESNSSGHSAVGSAALAGLNAAEVAGSIQASFMAAYGTPAMVNCW